MNQVLYLDQVASTNSFLGDYLKSNHPENFFAVLGYEQTAGRGQRGNSWFAERNKSLSCSIYLKNEGIHAKEQYIISKFTAYSLYICVKKFLPKTLSEGLKIKWPNDLYFQHKKLAGILIEHKLKGSSLEHSILGVGLNVNHEQFPQNLPNPISLKELTGQETPVEELLNSLIKTMKEQAQLLKIEHWAELNQAYMEALYRKEGLHLYEDKQGIFQAEIQGVADNGELILKKVNGTIGHYDIKDVQFKI